MSHLESVRLLLCDLFACVHRYKFILFFISSIKLLNKRLISPLACNPAGTRTIIGVPLQMPLTLTMRGMSTSTMATTMPTIRQIAIMFVVLETESKNV